MQEDMHGLVIFEDSAILCKGLEHPGVDVTETP